MPTKQEWLEDFKSKNGRTPTLDEFVQAVSTGMIDNQNGQSAIKATTKNTMPKELWTEYFIQRNGRNPNYQDYMDAIKAGDVLDDRKSVPNLQQTVSPQSIQPMEKEEWTEYFRQKNHRNPNYPDFIDAIKSGELIDWRNQGAEESSERSEPVEIKEPVQKEVLSAQAIPNTKPAPPKPPAPQETTTTHKKIVWNSDIDPLAEKRKRATNELFLRLNRKFSELIQGTWEFLDEDKNQIRTLAIENKNVGISVSPMDNPEQRNNWKGTISNDFISKQQVIDYLKRMDYSEKLEIIEQLELPQYYDENEENFYNSCQIEAEDGSENEVLNIFPFIDHPESLYVEGEYYSRKETNN